MLTAMKQRYYQVFDSWKIPPEMAKAEHRQYLDMAEIEYPHITRFGLDLQCRYWWVKTFIEDWAYVLFGRETSYMTPHEDWDPYYGGS